MIPRYVKPGELLAISPGRLHADRHGMFWMLGSGPLPNERKGDVITVHVRGELEHHKEEHNPAESYEGILEKMRAAYAGTGDEEDGEGAPPRAIVLVIDSPGGVVSGLNECVRELQKMRAEHPEIVVSCYVDEMACSAAYALACSCDEIVCPPSAILGSIGVISTMVSATRADKKAGFDVQLITSGARKADGHLHAPLTDGAIQAETARVEKLATAFFRLAAKARKLSVDKIRSFQAGIFLGKDAIRVGLANRLASLEEITKAGQTGPTTPAAGGNQTDRRENKRMNLLALIKSTKAALAKEDDPKKIALLSTTLGSYAAALAAYKKTKHVEHTEEEDDGGDEDDEDEDKKDEDEGDDAKSSKGEEDEKASAEDDEEKASAEDDDEEESEEKSAKKSAALVQKLTGKSGAAGRGELRAMAMFAAKAEQRLATLEKQNKATEKATLIASVTGKYFTPTEAKNLASMPLAEVRALVAFAKKRGAIVHTEAGELLHPKAAKPGSVDALPKEIRDMIDNAVAHASGDKKKIREELEAANLKTYNDTLNGAGGRL